MARDNLAEDWPPLRTITDLAFRHWNVELSCPSCRHRRVMSGAGLWWLFQRKHWPDALGDVRRKFYCAYCFVRTRKKIVPTIGKTRDVPTGAPLPDPPEHEWKRQVARFRN